MVTNLAYFYETSQKTRGGKWVWVKDSNGEERKNVLLGGTILNPKKGFDHLYAAQLVQYTPSVGMLIFRSFGVKTATAAATDTTIYLNGDGYGDAPEVGMLIMKAPSAANGTGQSALVTNVVYDEANEQFAVTLSVALGTLAAGDILVEDAKGLQSDDIVGDEIIPERRDIVLMSEGLAALPAREKEIMLTYMEYDIGTGQYLPRNIIKALCDKFKTTSPNLRKIKERSLKFLKNYVESHR